MNDKVLGIIGGMGPEATVELMRRVVKGTPAGKEEDHIRMLVDCNPKVPSRMKALIDGSGESPGAYLARTARNLELAGADFLAMPCITAHYYFKEICSAVKIRVLNMVSLGIDAVLEGQPGPKSIGILASTAVLITGIYERGFKDKGIYAIYPSPGQQEQVLLAIKQVKVGDFSEKVVNIVQGAIEELMDREAESLLLACTELSLITNQLHAKVKLIDSLQVLADRIILEASC